MQPWMIIAALIGVGILVLLVAPTIHRRINANSRAAAEQGRRDRADALRRSSSGAERLIADAGVAVRIRDLLLLRGVRVELVRESEGVVVVYERTHEDALERAIAEIEND